MCAVWQWYCYDPRGFDEEVLVIDYGSLAVDFLIHDDCTMFSCLAARVKSNEGADKEGGGLAASSTT